MLYTCRLAHFVQIGGNSWTWTPQLSRTFRTSFANLSQICSTKSLIHMSTHVSFRGFRGALLLSRAFANQHFPFAQAPQINLHIKVNVRGFFRSSFNFPTWSYTNSNMMAALENLLAKTSFFLHTSLPPTFFRWCFTNFRIVDFVDWWPGLFILSPHLLWNSCHTQMLNV